MENKEIELRKNQIINFLKAKKNWIQYILLAIILWLAYFIRSQNWEFLKDATTGKYISLEVDSTIFLRYAQYIAEHGKLFAVDMLRSFPYGLQIDFGVFTSYFVAYLYKFLSLFSSTVTVEYIDVIYPTIATIIAAVFLFLFVRRLFDYRVALLSALFLITLPVFLFRSISSDHDILGLMFVFMTLYFFVVAWQSTKIKNNIIFALLAAFVTILGFNTAGNIKVFVMVVALFTIVHVVLDSVKKSDLYVYPVWYLTTFFVLFLMDKVTMRSMLSDYTFGIPAVVAFLSLVIYYVFEHTKVNKTALYKKMLTKLPGGFLVFLSTAVLSFISVILVLGFNGLKGIFQGVLNMFSEALVFNRWASTVAENKRVFIIDWFSNFGVMLFWLFIIGLIFIIYKLTKELKEGRKLFYVYAVCILAFIFSKYSQDSILNGGSGLSKFLFYGSVFVVLIYTIYYHIVNYQKSVKSNTKYIVDLNWKYTLILIIALVNVVGGTTAVRLFFELSPFVVIVASFALVSLFDYFLDLDSKVLKYAGVIFLVLLLFSPFSFAKGIVLENAKAAYDQVRFTGPSYDQQWQKAGEWVRQNTPENSVFIHWWDYGYWVQAGFERATVTDGGNRIWWWNYLTARNVLTAPNDEDSLKFLYAHNVTHLLIVNEEIGKYPAYSLIGSDKNYDRYSFINFMSLDRSLVQETRNGTVLVYTGGYPLDEDLITRGNVYPRGTFILGVFVPVENYFDENGTITGGTFRQPSIILNGKNGQEMLSIKCIHADKLYTFENYEYGGCIKIVPNVQNNKIDNIGAAVFLSRRVADSLFGRLYLLQQNSSYFKLVYSDEGNTPVMLYDGRNIGPTKIWKVNYPEGFSINKSEYGYYNSVGFGDPALMDF